MTAINKSVLHKPILKFNNNHTNYYIEGIQNNDYKVLEKIYATFLPSVTKFVVNNNGTTEEALDVFQDGLMVIYKKLKRGELDITVGFHSYLFAVCKYIWMNELRKSRRTEVSIGLSQEFIDDTDIQSDIEEAEKQTFFRSKLEALPQDYKTILKMFFAKKSFKEIAEELNFSVEYAKKKKYLAKKMLIELVRKDKMFKQLT